MLTFFTTFVTFWSCRLLTPAAWAIPSCLSSAYQPIQDVLQVATCCNEKPYLNILGGSFFDEQG